MRTIDEIREDLRLATNALDVDSIRNYAAEMRELQTPEATARALHALGVVSRITGEFDAAVEQLHRSMVIFKEIDKPLNIAQVIGELGIVYENAGDYPAALEHYGQQRRLAEETNNANGIVSAATNSGNIFFYHGDYPAALESWQQALAASEGLNDASPAAGAIGNIGNVYSRIGDFTSALSWYERAVAIYAEKGDRVNEAITTVNIGFVHARLGDHISALKNYRHALELQERLGNVYGASNARTRMIEALMMTGAIDEARDVLAILVATPLVNPWLTAEREQKRAMVYAHDNDLDAALQSLETALQIAQQSGLRSLEASVRLDLRELAQLRNNLADYITHNNEYTRITEEILGQQATTALALKSKQREIEAERKETEKYLAVLHSTLPKEVAERVARGEVVNDHFENAAVIFLDIVGFTEISSSMSSQEVITLLDNVFTQCDAICAKHNVTKIKTIGDSYMAVSFDGVVNAALCALEFNQIQYRIHNTESNQRILQYRIGVHCGAVTAGVIGKERMQYDVWGDTVNVASRMESSGEAGRIHISEAFASELKRNTEYTIQNPISHEVPLVTRHSSLVTIERGSIDIKGKGPMNTYWLEQ